MKYLYHPGTPIGSQSFYFTQSVLYQVAKIIISLEAVVSAGSNPPLATPGQPGLSTPSISSTDNHWQAANAHGKIDW
jgi:hypothetical protein